MTNPYSKVFDDAATPYLDLLRGKTVTILGGDDEIDWARAESSDVVVRINGHWRRQEGRIDALWWSCASDLHGLGDWGEFAACASGCRFVWLNKTHDLFGANGGTFADDSATLLELKIPFAEYWHAPAPAFDVFAVLRENVPADYWAKELAERFGFYPLTGVLAAAYTIERTEASNIYLDGFSFYQGASGALPAKAGKHAVAPNVECFRTLVLENRERVELSEKLRKILFP